MTTLETEIYMPQADWIIVSYREAKQSKASKQASKHDLVALA